MRAIIITITVYIYICVCVCVCMYKRKNKEAKEKEYLYSFVRILYFVCIFMYICLRCINILYKCISYRLCIRYILGDICIICTSKK